MSFYYDINEMLWELNPCLYQLGYGKIGSVIHHYTTVQEPIVTIKLGLTVFKPVYVYLP